MIPSCQILKRGKANPTAVKKSQSMAYVELLRIWILVMQIPIVPLQARIQYREYWKMFVDIKVGNVSPEDIRHK
jgi:hypothetical protein